MLVVVSVLCDSALASGWSIQATPILGGQPQDVLNGVSCTSSTGCTAVGDYVNRTGTKVTLVERWNGSGWSSQPTPGLSGNPVLDGVSCETAGDCTAVGEYRNSSGTEVTLAEHWNGTTWTIQVTPNPSGATSSALSGVSCTPEGECMAVGGYVNASGASQSLAESWNGSMWSIAGSPTGGGLSRVSCTGAMACTAVDGGTLVERWDGTAWTTQAFAFPAGTTSMQLYGVTCLGASTCVAVGHWLSIHCNNGQPTCNCFRYPYCTIRQSTMVEWWDGSAWTIGSNPGPVGFFYDVSCPATNDCTAVGRAAGNQELAARWNGTGWTVQSTPTLSAGGSLSSVSCTAASACTAVGQTGGVSLAERWDGMGWAIQRTVNPAGPANPRLSGVSCTTATVCTAVGSYTNTSGSQVGLAENWTGTSWSTQPTAVPNGSVGNFLSGVSCNSQTACTAAGADGTGFGNPVPDVALAEAWNGAGWTDEQAPTPSGDQSILTGVSCPVPTSCVAVGYAYPLGAGSQVLLAERWNGASWAIEPTRSRPAHPRPRSQACRARRRRRALGWEPLTGRSSPSSGTGVPGRSGPHPGQGASPACPARQRMRAWGWGARAERR